MSYSISKIASLLFLFSGLTPGPWAGPGKRWRFSMETDGTFMAIFGGHRLWHGYSIENSQANDWSTNTTRQPGGYLNDLWIYTKELDFVTRNGETFHTTVGSWKQMQPKYVCRNSWDKVSWDRRFDTACTVTDWLCYPHSSYPTPHTPHPTSPILPYHVYTHTHTHTHSILSLSLSLSRSLTYNLMSQQTNHHHHHHHHHHLIKLFNNSIDYLARWKSWSRICYWLKEKLNMDLRWL